MKGNPYHKVWGFNVLIACLEIKLYRYTNEGLVFFVISRYSWSSISSIHMWLLIYSVLKKVASKNLFQFWNNFKSIMLVFFMRRKNTKKLETLNFFSNMLHRYKENITKKWMDNRTKNLFKNYIWNITSCRDNNYCYVKDITIFKKTYVYSNAAIKTMEYFLSVLLFCV